MKISFIFLRSRSRSICTLITLIASFGTPFSLGAQAIKTNILSDFAMMPSIAVELPLGRRLSLDVGYNGAWWENRASAFCVKSHGGQLGIRYWFEDIFNGHHLGVYGLGHSYDFCFGKKGMQSDDWCWGADMEYGYLLPLGKSIALDFSAGFGILGGNLKEYEPQDSHFVWQSNKRYRWFGPTRASVSLVWTIGRMRHEKQQ